MTFHNAAATVVAVVVAVTVPSPPATAHVAPSVDDNNRYLKVTPLRDGIRLAYTVFFGEIPGASERRSIDDNRDGRIDDAEANRFATQLGAQVAASIDIEVDGVPHRVQWDLISAGMGSDAVAAGSFSIDLVAFACTTSTSSHRIILRDQFRIPRPGETEVKVEDSPGVAITRAHVGPANDPTRNFRFAGPGGPLSDDGLALEYTASDKTPTVPAGKCGAAPPPTKPTSSLLAIGITCAVIVLGGVALIILRRRGARTE
jgi:hypothetical protein